MFISSILARADLSEAGPSCSPFTFQNSVCVGDFVAILAFSVSGFGFLVWFVHEIRKTRKTTSCTYDPEKEMREIAAKRARDPFGNAANVDEAFVVQQGLTPSADTLERVRARMTLTHPAAYDDYGSNIVPLPGVKMPRMPPPVETSSSWSFSHSPPQYSSLYFDGPYGENGHGVKEVYFTNTRSSRAMEMPLYRPQ